MDIKNSMKRPPLPPKDDRSRAPEEDPKFNLFRDVVLFLLLIAIVFIIMNLKK